MTEICVFGAGAIGGLVAARLLKAGEADVTLVAPGAHRSSMLQDVDAGRPTELDALLGVVIELAQMTGIATPALKLVYDLARFRARVA